MSMLEQIENIEKEIGYGGHENILEMSAIYTLDLLLIIAKQNEEIISTLKDGKQESNNKEIPWKEK